jgi:putative glutamine amidotransferase
VCRGLQALVNHFGGSLSPIDGHVQTRHSVELDPEWMAVPDGRIEVNSFHNMAIKTDDLPGQLTAVAWSEDGTIEAVVHSEYRINGIMWHPEREVMPSALDVALINKLFVPDR